MSADDVLFDNSPGANFIDVRIPYIFGIDHDHRPMTTLVHAARVVDTHSATHSGGRYSLLERRVNLKRPVERTCFSAGTHEHVALVLTHRTKMGAQPPR